MLNEAVGICPECKAKNILPEPETPDVRQPSYIPLAINFDCFRCKKRVNVLVAELIPISGSGSL